MKRISVVGACGSGKSTFAQKLSKVTGIPHIELDALFWKENWQESSREEMLAKVNPYLEKEEWIIDGNYSFLIESIWERADTIIWLDTPKLLNLFIITRRSFIRAISKQNLWGKNQETFKQFFSKKSIFLWVWKTYNEYKLRYEKQFQNKAKNEASLVKMIRLHSHWEMDTFINTISKSPNYHFVQKILAYIVRNEKIGNKSVGIFEPTSYEILAFRHPVTHLIEVVRGTLESIETPYNATLREIYEETGLIVNKSKLHRFAYLSSFIKGGSEKNENWEYQLHHGFVFQPEEDLPDEWTHQVTGHGIDQKRIYNFFWIDIDEAKKTMGEKGASFLPDLKEYLIGET